MTTQVWRLLPDDLYAQICTIIGLWLQAEIDANDPHHGPGAVGASKLQKALARIQGDAAERIMSKYTVSHSGHQFPAQRLAMAC